MNKTFYRATIYTNKTINLMLCVYEWQAIAWAISHIMNNYEGLSLGEDQSLIDDKCREIKQALQSSDQQYGIDLFNNCNLIRKFAFCKKVDIDL